MNPPDETLYEMLNELASDDRVYSHWHWSDYFEHAATVLAIMYLSRGKEKGKSVREWLRAIVESEGVMSMTASIEGQMGTLQAYIDNGSTIEAFRADPTAPWRMPDFITPHPCKSYYQQKNSDACLNCRHTLSSHLKNKLEAETPAQVQP